MKKIISLFFLMHLSNGIAQNKSSEAVIDSIFKTIPNTASAKDLIFAYNKIAFEYASLDSDKGLEYGEKALALSKKIKWDEGKSNALIGIGENNFCQGKYKEAFQNYEAALLYSKDKKTIGIINREMATVYSSQSDYIKATQYAFAALTISENAKDESENAKNYNTIGITYFYTNQTQKALAYFNKALQINVRLNLKREICKTLQNIGAEYADIYDTKNAIIYFNKSLSLAQEIDFKESLAVCNFNLGRLYVDNEQLDK
jgi:tetratricopeptide (TPR) repeat protein